MLTRTINAYLTKAAAFYPNETRSKLRPISGTRSGSCARPIPGTVNSAELAALCGVTVRTARRWKARGVMPGALAVWVAIATGGCLGSVDPVWRGWRVACGRLYSQDLAHGFTPADVLSLPFVQAQVRHYQRDQRFPRQADAFSGVYERVPEMGRPGPSAGDPGAICAGPGRSARR